MKLPDLPKKNNKKEADFGVKLRKFYKDNPGYSCSLETKHTDGILPFREVEEEQLQYALAIRGDVGVLLRIHPLVKGMPDYIYLRKTPSWIVISYKGKGFVWISPDRFILERDKSKKRSLTFARACEIASKVVK